jgi:hypothetical protein
VLRDSFSVTRRDKPRCFYTLPLARNGHETNGNNRSPQTRHRSQLDFRQIFADNDASGKIPGDFLHKPVEHTLAFAGGDGSERAS